MAKFIGFIKRAGALYGGTVAEFEDGNALDQRRFVLNVRHLLERQHRLREQNLDTTEEDRAIVGVRVYLDGQQWRDAERDFREWLEARPTGGTVRGED